MPAAAWERPASQARSRLLAGSDLRSPREFCPLFLYIRNTKNIKETRFRARVVKGYDSLISFNFEHHLTTDLKPSFFAPKGDLENARPDNVSKKLSLDLRSMLL